MDIQFVGLPSPTVAAIRAQGQDAYGLPVERKISGGAGYPCRHCLSETPHGETYLILAHRPFSGVNAYTETGPIFLCEQECAAHVPSAEVPQILVSPTYMLRGYTADERILYGTGKVVPRDEIAQYATTLFATHDLAFVDVRSASNNCFQCRIFQTSSDPHPS